MTDNTSDPKIQELFSSENEKIDGVSTFKGDNWKSTGAFLLEFSKDGKLTEIIVDDYIPLNNDNEPLYARGGPNGNEIWICILEKAYAKLYGDYSNIKSG